MLIWVKNISKSKKPKNLLTKPLESLLNVLWSIRHWYRLITDQSTFFFGKGKFIKNEANKTNKAQPKRKRHGKKQTSKRNYRFSNGQQNQSAQLQVPKLPIQFSQLNTMLIMQSVVLVGELYHLLKNLSFLAFQTHQRYHR